MNSSLMTRSVFGKNATRLQESNCPQAKAKANDNMQMQNFWISDYLSNAFTLDVYYQKEAHETKKLVILDLICICIVEKPAFWFGRGCKGKKVLICYLPVDFKILFFWLKKRRRVLEGFWPPPTPFVNPPQQKNPILKGPHLVFHHLQYLWVDNI